MKFIVSDDIDPIPNWKIGLWIWKTNGAWRLRLYRPWRKERLVEATCNEFLWALYTLGVGAHWWKGPNA